MFQSPLARLALFSAVSVGATPSLAQRLWFDAVDVPAIRSKLDREPYASMAAAIQGNLDPIAGDGETSSTTRIGERANEARNAGSMYVLTGEQQYADRALAMVQALVAETDFWGQSSANALRRSEMAAAVVQAYDFAGVAWDPVVREDVRQQLLVNGDSLMQGGGSGWPGNNAPANNWHGVRWSSAIISYLAADDLSRDAAVDLAYDNLVTHFEANLGGNTAQRENGRGWNPEGLGYTQWPSNRSWGQAAVALERLRGLDLLADGPPGLKHTLSTAHITAVAIEGIDGDIGIIPDFSDDSNFLAGRGLGNFAFVHSPEEYLPALRWQYDRLWGAQGRANYDSRDGAGIWGILYYPEDVAAQNPEEVWGLNYVDEHFAMTMFRDRYQDENDLVAMHSARWRNANAILENTHWGPDVNGIRLIGLNSVWATSGKNDAQHQTSVSSLDPVTIGRINPDRQGHNLGFVSLDAYFTHGDDGSGYSVVTGTDMGDSQSIALFGTINHKRRFAVDYDAEETGVRGVYVVGDSSTNGNFWRWNAGGMNTVETDATAGTFTFTSPDGHRLIGYVLHGNANTFRTGSVERNRDIPYEGERIDNNVWVDLQDSGDNDFLVLLQMVEAGNDPTAFTASGAGYEQTIHVGRQTYHVEPERVWAESWNDWTGGDGLFGDAGNWRFAAPGGAGAWATFETASPVTATVDQDVSLGNVVFGGAGFATIDGLWTLTLTAPDAVGKLDVSGAGGDVQTALTLHGTTIATVEIGSLLTLSGAVSFGDLFVKRGHGALELAAAALGPEDLGALIAVIGGSAPTVEGAFYLRALDPTAVEAQLLAAGLDPSDGLALFELTATPVLAGDYNGDGVVDAADFTVWRDAQGTTTALANDTIGGVVGQAHYDVWAAMFGATLQPAVTVPEPAVILTALVGFGLVPHRRWS